MKQLLLAFATFAATAMILTGCSEGANSMNKTKLVTANLGPPPILDSQGHSGAIQDVFAGPGAHNRWYKITNVTVSKVGKVYTHVTFGADHKGAEPQGPGGVISNVLPAGTPLYAIPEIDPARAIAVPWKGVYYKAVRTNQ